MRAHTQLASARGWARAQLVVASACGVAVAVAVGGLRAQLAGLGLTSARLQIQELDE